jgi:hypothetical protein
MSRDKILFGLLIALFSSSAIGEQPSKKAGPKIGDIINGKEVTCIWMLSFKCVQNVAARGDRGTFGLLLTPLSKDTTTEASLTWTEEKDVRDGKVTLSFQSGKWSFHATNLRYIDADGGVSRVSSNITKSGVISPKGSIYRDVQVTFAPDGSSAAFSVGLDNGSPELKFPVRYPDLEMKTVTHVVVSSSKKRSETWQACLMSGWVDVPLPLAQKGSTGADASASRTLDFNVKGLSDPRNTNGAEWTVTRTCQQPPKLAHDPNEIKSGIKLQPPVSTATPEASNPWSDWVHTAIRGIETDGGKSPR